MATTEEHMRFLKGILDGVNVHRARIADLETQRDEARAEVDRMRRALVAAKRVAETRSRCLERLKRERDEGWAKLEEAVDTICRLNETFPNITKDRLRELLDGTALPYGRFLSFIGASGFQDIANNLLILRRELGLDDEAKAKGAQPPQIEIPCDVCPVSLGEACDIAQGVAKRIDAAHAEAVEVEAEGGYAYVGIPPEHQEEAEGILREAATLSRIDDAIDKLKARVLEALPGKFKLHSDMRGWIITNAQQVAIESLEGELLDGFDPAKYVLVDKAWLDGATGWEESRLEWLRHPDDAVRELRKRAGLEVE